jgi:hypothetical protein
VLITQKVLPSVTHPADNRKESDGALGLVTSRKSVDGGFMLVQVVNDFLAVELPGDRRVVDLRAYPVLVAGQKMDAAVEFFRTELGWIVEDLRRIETETPGEMVDLEWFQK